VQGKGQLDGLLGVDAARQEGNQRQTQCQNHSFYQHLPVHCFLLFLVMFENTDKLPVKLKTPLIFHFQGLAEQNFLAVFS
jgi:hypothetical protein